MNRLPGVESAIIPKAKIIDYLLSRTHTFGRSKSAFFEGIGFSPNDWEQLREAMLKHARDSNVVNVEETAFGTKYIVDGALPTPDGRNPLIRSVWFVESGEREPRFVTAYPHSGGGR